MPSVTKEEPQYEHDCNACKFLGTYTFQEEGYTYMGTTDLYYCANKEHPSLSSLLARYSDEASEYTSSHPPEAFAKGYEAPEWVRILISRAREAGVYLEPSARPSSLFDEKE